MYTANDACLTIERYLNTEEGLIKKDIIPETKNRGIVLTLPNNEKVVVFIYPLVHKQDDTKNYFDTRDSGPHERAKTWNYALTRGLKYFCLGVNDQVPKYQEYVFSLECTEREIERLSGTESGDRSTYTSGNQIIIPNSFEPTKPFERITNNLGTFISAVHTSCLLDYLDKYDNRPYLSKDDLVEAEMPLGDGSDSVQSSRVGSNILLYGVPGAGKSFTVKKEYTFEKKGEVADYVERVVFHPDYTYSDFIGQLLPKVENDNTATYMFSPGPFTRILKKAQNDPDTHYWLVIEEINRGNAPAIFGDLFQLLDRKEDGSSEYAITNADIAKEVYKNSEKKVTLPGNLSIIATMNTSDQNVFTLDTAFQRRWQMKMIDNDFDECIDTPLMNTEVLDTGVKWKDFAKVINKSIVEANASNMISTADKQLGTHFVSKNELKSKSEVFAEKVLKYLWDDAVKMNPDKVFSPDYNELRLVIKAFNSKTGSEKFNVFNEKIRTALLEIVKSLNPDAVSSDVGGSQDGSDDN